MVLALFQRCFAPSYQNDGVEKQPEQTNPHEKHKHAARPAAAYSDCSVTITPRLQPQLEPQQQQQKAVVEHLQTLFNNVSAAGAAAGSDQVDLWSKLQKIVSSMAAVLPACSISINVPTTSRRFVKIVTPLRSDDELRPISEVPCMLDVMTGLPNILKVPALCSTSQATTALLLLGQDGQQSQEANRCSYFTQIPLKFGNVPQGTLLIATQGAAMPVQDLRCLASFWPLLSLHLFEGRAVQLCDMLEKLQISSCINSLALNVTQELHKCFDWCNPEETEARLVLLNTEQSTALVLSRTMHTSQARTASERTLPRPSATTPPCPWPPLPKTSTLAFADTELQGMQVPLINTLTQRCMLEGSKLCLFDIMSAMKASGQAWSDVFLSTAVVTNPAWVLVAPIVINRKQCGAVLWISSTRLSPKLALPAAKATIPPILAAVSRCLHRFRTTSEPSIARQLTSQALQQLSRLGPTSPLGGVQTYNSDPQTLVHGLVSDGSCRLLPSEIASVQCNVSRSDSAPTLALMRAYQATIAQHQRSTVSRRPSVVYGEDEQTIEVISKAGQGTFGSVYVAIWKGLMVAVKVMRAQAESRKAMRMAWELAVSNSLHHPNIARVHAVLTDVTVEKAGRNAIRFSPTGRSQRMLELNNSHPLWEPAFPTEDGEVSPMCQVIIMEYCSKGSLNHLLTERHFIKEASYTPWKAMAAGLGAHLGRTSWQRDGGLRSPSESRDGTGGSAEFALRRARSMTLHCVPLRPILSLLIDIASAMRYIHHSGFIHCDLKPENLLIKTAPGSSSGFTVLVADFGLTDLHTANGPLMGELGGTITHIAPEVITHKRVTTACDVYAFGIIMYELYTCQRPYEDILRSKLDQADQDKAIMHRVAREELRPPFPKSAPQDYVSLAQRCWASDPTSRPHFGEVLLELRALLQQDEEPGSGSGKAPECVANSCPSPRGPSRAGVSATHAHGATRMSHHPPHPVIVGWRTAAEKVRSGGSGSSTVESPPGAVAGGGTLGSPQGPANVHQPGVELVWPQKQRMNGQSRDGGMKQAAAKGGDVYQAALQCGVLLADAAGRGKGAAPELGGDAALPRSSFGSNPKSCASQHQHHRREQQQQQQCQQQQQQQEQQQQQQQQLGERPSHASSHEDDDSRSLHKAMTL